MNPDPEPVRIPITDVFDLHSVPPRDVKGVVEEYLLEARAAGFESPAHHSRPGNRRAARDCARGAERSPFVAEFRDAPAEAGGWGATIATLR